MDNKSFTTLDGTTLYYGVHQYRPIILGSVTPRLWPATCDGPRLKLGEL